MTGFKPLCSRQEEVGARTRALPQRQVTEAQGVGQASSDRHQKDDEREHIKRIAHFVVWALAALAFLKHTGAPATEEVESGKEDNGERGG